MRIDWTISIEKFNEGAFLMAVQAHLRALLIKSMRLFLLAAVPRVPIRTGFARSSLKNLEDVAGKINADAASAGGFRVYGTRGGGSNLKNSKEYYTGGGTKILKTNQSGRQFATQANDILNLSGAKIASGRAAFYFKFSVNITYFELLDKTVWGAFKAGTDAMEVFIRGNLNVGFPQVGKFLARKST